MNRKNYKKKVAEIFSFKSPKSEKFKQITQEDNNSPKETKEGQNKGSAMANVQPKTEVTQVINKRDVIVIGAGLSGKYYWIPLVRQKLLDFIIFLF